MYNIDNSKLVIPFYDDIPSDAQYPCSTERLAYNKDDHRYYLTEAGLSYYGVQCAPSEVKKLIRAATEHVYSYIAIMAQTKYNVMCYRIAKSLFGRFKSAKEGRNEFEYMLAIQADYISEFGDAKKTPKMVISPETGRVKDNDLNWSTGFWLSDEVLIWLKNNNLTDPNIAYYPWQIRWDEY